MAFNDSNGSFSKNNNNRSRQLAKRVLPRFQSVSKRSDQYSQHNDCLRGHEAGLYRMHRKKAAAVFPESEIDDIDIEKQLIFSEGLYDESDGMWLSSDCKSPPLLSSDNSQDVWEFDCWDISINDRFSSTISLSKKNRGSFFDGSRISPIDEASLVLDRRCEGIDQKHVQEKLVAVENEVTDSSLGCSESGDSSYDRSLCEESSMFESPCTSLSAHCDTPSYARDFDRTGIWVSLLDLGAEDLDLVQDKEQGFDVFGPNFLSPRCSARSNPVTTPSSSAHDEPLFWPFDHSSYWSPEFDKNFLSLSPRKDVRRVISAAKSIRLRLHQKINPPIVSENGQGCRRRIAFSSTPNSATANRRTGGRNNTDVQKINGVSSRRSSQALSQQHPRDNSMKQRPVQRQKHRCGREFSRLLLELEASNIQDLVVEGVPIEKLVGLNEFDGHEGISAELDDELCILHGSPYKKEIPLRAIGRSGRQK